jgi:hypothetical protein
MYETHLYPGVPLMHWQMMDCERIALTGLLARLRPKLAIEVGVYHGGSLTLISQFSERVIALDIDADVPNRFAIPINVDLRIGDSATILPKLIHDLDQARAPLNLVLIDANHSADGVRCDIESVLHFQPTQPMAIVIHDGGNAECRRGVTMADWQSNQHVHNVELDFVPAQIIEHTVSKGTGEVWGGLALAYLDPQVRTHALQVRAGAATTVRALHRCAADLSLLDQ